MIIGIVQDQCIGCSSCVRTVPGVFKLGKFRLWKKRTSNVIPDVVPVDKENAVRQAISNCPATAIIRF
jgi:ferredoxin